MKSNVQRFIDALLSAEALPKPEEPDIGEIEKISPEEFKLLSSVIKLCDRITDEQIDNYINYINNALKNSGDWEKFLQLSAELKNTVHNEEFL